LKNQGFGRLKGGSFQHFQQFALLKTYFSAFSHFLRFAILTSIFTHLNPIYIFPKKDNYYS